MSDRKFGVSSAESSLIDHYEPYIVTAQDYYPFGMLSRVALPGNDKSYRFGFNGKMNDNEVKGGLGNQQDYGMRIYDSRVGRFLSVDPLTRDYAELTPYQFSSNRPIDGVDLDGGEWKPVTDWLADKAKANGYPTLSGFVRGLGAMDVQAQTNQLIGNAVTGNHKAVAKQLYGYSLKGMVDNLEETTKRAIDDNDHEAYGELCSFVLLGALGEAGMGEPPSIGGFKFSEHPVAKTNKLAIEAHGKFEAGEGNAANTSTNRVYTSSETSGTGGNASNTAKTSTNKNSKTAESEFILYDIHELPNKEGELLKVGKADAERVRADGRPDRMAVSQRKARKAGYPNATGTIRKQLGKTTTEHATNAEAAEVRKERANGNKLPLNKEKSKKYKQ